MLAITGATRLWYVSNVTNMRFGKYRLFSEVQAQGMDAYNGDAYLFMSKNRRTVKFILYTIRVIGTGTSIIVNQALCHGKFGRQRLEVLQRNGLRASH